MFIWTISDILGLIGVAWLALLFLVIWIQDRKLKRKI
jgi:hypothetical protein